MIVPIEITPEQLIGEIVLKMHNESLRFQGSIPHPEWFLGYEGVAALTREGNAYHHSSYQLGFTVVVDGDMTCKKSHEEVTVTNTSIGRNKDLILAGLHESWQRVCHAVHSDDDFGKWIANDVMEIAEYPLAGYILPKAARACGYSCKLVEHDGDDVTLHIVGENKVWFSISLTAGYHNLSVSHIHAYGDHAKDDISASLEKITEAAEKIRDDSFASVSNHLFVPPSGLKDVRRKLASIGADGGEYEDFTLTLTDASAIALKMLELPEGCLWISE